VHVKHFNINTGFTVPITGWVNRDIILSSVNVYLDEICTGLHPTKFIIICACTSDGRSSGHNNCELLIFCGSDHREKNDQFEVHQCQLVKYMCTVANWYASISNLAPQSNKLVP
jgi:hypothetical protein